VSAEDGVPDRDGVGWDDLTAIRWILSSIPVTGVWVPVSGYPPYDAPASGVPEGHDGGSAREHVDRYPGVSPYGAE
jgi:hypothetical protein